MGRLRVIKPDFFKHEGLFDAERSSGLPIRLAFAGLWCQCDREGRFRWIPRRLKVDILPYDNVDFDAILAILEKTGFIIRYSAGSEVYGFIPSWAKHQMPHHKEKESQLPDPQSDGCMICASVMHDSSKSPEVLRESVNGNLESDIPPKPPTGAKPNSLKPSESPDDAAAGPEGSGGPAPTASEVMDVWNVHAKASGWTQCHAMGVQRMKSYRARCQDKHWLENWRAALAKASRLLWMRGENIRQWVADIDWFLRPRTAIRILEGKYDDRPQPGGSVGSLSRVRAPADKYANIGTTVNSDLEAPARPDGPAPADGAAQRGGD